MPKIVEGVFRSGKVEFTQPPAARDGDRVIVTFLSEERSSTGHQPIRYGMFRTNPGRETSWEDFQEAKRAMYKHLPEGDDADAARG